MQKLVIYLFLLGLLSSCASLNAPDDVHRDIENQEQSMPQGLNFGDKW